jgi:hypothetical protein
LLLKASKAMYVSNAQKYRKKKKGKKMQILEATAIARISYMSETSTDIV